MSYEWAVLGDLVMVWWSCVLGVEHGAQTNHNTYLTNVQASLQQQESAQSQPLQNVAVFRTDGPRLRL